MIREKSCVVQRWAWYRGCEEFSYKIQEIGKTSFVTQEEERKLLYRFGEKREEGM